MKPENILELVKNKFAEDFYDGSLYIIVLEDGSKIEIEHNLITLIKNDLNLFKEEYSEFLESDEGVTLIEFINSDLEPETCLKAINTKNMKFVREDMETNSYLEVYDDLDTSIESFVGDIYE